MSYYADRSLARLEETRARDKRCRRGMYLACVCHFKASGKSRSLANKSFVADARPNQSVQCFRPVLQMSHCLKSADTWVVTVWFN